MIEATRISKGDSAELARRTVFLGLHDLILMRFSVELDDLANGLALAQAVESQVDIVERQAMRQQSIDRQASAPIQRDKTRQIAARDASPDIAPLDRALFGLPRVSRTSPLDWEGRP
jgi:hypothetical protein